MGEPLEVVGLAFVGGEFFAVVVEASLCDCQHGFENTFAEFFADTLLEHVPRVAVADAVFNDIVKNSGYDCRFIPIVPRQYHGDIGWMREVGKLGSFSHLPIVMLRSECERVVDGVGISAYGCQTFLLNHSTSFSSPT